MAISAHQRLGRSFLGAAFALALIASPAQAAPVGAVDTGPCVAFDALGYRYIAFGRSGIAEPGIYLATNRSGAWRLSAHPITPGQRCAGMLVDADRHVHLLAVDRGTFDPDLGSAHLRYVTNRSGNWRASQVYIGEIGFATLGLGRTGRPSVAVYDQNGYFVFERTGAGSWAMRIVGDGLISHMWPDRSGALWLLAVGLDRHRPLFRITDRSGAWDISRVTQPYSGIRDIEFAIDRSGNRFLYAYDEATGKVGVFRADGTSWTFVGRTRTQPGRLLREAVIEPGGAPHLMLLVDRTRTEWGIVDMNKHDGVWHTQLIGYGSPYADLAIDGRGRVAATFDRDGVVWSYWNDWKGPVHRFRVSDL